MGGGKVPSSIKQTPGEAEGGSELLKRAWPKGCPGLPVGVSWERIMRGKEERGEIF